MGFYIIILLVLAIDQASKIYIRSSLEIGESVELWTGVLHLTRYENSGIAFGMLEGYGQYFIPIALLVAVFGIYFKQKKYFNRRMEEIAMAFFVGGALGNAIDRALFNQVTDFIDFQFKGGILNLADYAINIGMLLLIINLLIIGRKKTAPSQQYGRAVD